MQKQTEQQLLFQNLIDRDVIVKRERPDIDVHVRADSEHDLAR